MPEVVVMVGMQGCGKSTWVKEHLAASHLVVSKELWPNLAHRDQRRRRAIGDALAEGLDVVVDDANASPLERSALITVARERGARVRAVHVDTPVPACVARHASRPGHPGPIAELLATRRRLVPPSTDEGFDAVETVVNGAGASRAGGAGRSPDCTPVPPAPPPS